MGTGYNISFDRTCYDITYNATGIEVPQGTYLFNVTIFVEAGVSGLIYLLSEVEFVFANTFTNYELIYHWQPSPQVTMYTRVIVSGQTGPNSNMNLQTNTEYGGQLFVVLVTNF